MAGLLAAGAIVLSRVLTVEQAYRGIAWTTVVLVAGMIPLSTAMVSTGAASTLAERLVDVDGDSGPHMLLLGLVLLTLALGQLIPNMATALIMIPDYWKLGLPLLVLFGAVAVLLVPVFWSF